MLTVGRELLIGRTVNTNAYWAGGRLAAMGTMLTRIITVDDDLEQIGSGLSESLKRSPDFVVVVGGLGPTPDDMTLEGIAKCLGRSMRMNPEALSMMKRHYEEVGRKGVRLTKARRKMAILPSGARPIANDAGTAPAVRLEVGTTVVFSLPGVPREMKSIFRKSVEPEIGKKLGKLHRGHLSLKLEGIMESALAPLIEAELRKHPGAYIKSHPRGVKDGVSRIELDVAVIEADKGAAESAVDNIESEMRRAIEAAGAKVIARRGRLSGGRVGWT
jgi:molybdenum cofactor synthesis domain-containing protein